MIFSNKFFCVHNHAPFGTTLPGFAAFWGRSAQKTRGFPAVYLKIIYFPGTSRRQAPSTTSDKSPVIFSWFFPFSKKFFAINIFVSCILAHVFIGDTSKLQPKLHPGLCEEAARDVSASGDCAQKPRRRAVRGGVRRRQKAACRRAGFALWPYP
jgi:hypothetical protein